MGAYARAASRAPSSNQDELIRTISAEYHEMPGLCLTRTQFRRLWQLGDSECDAVVRELKSRHYLVEAADGRLVRRHETR